MDIQTPIIADVEIVKVIQDYWQELKGKRGQFSLRSLAKRLDIHPAALSEMLSGKRKISQASARKILEKLSLPPAQQEKILGLYPTAKSTTTKMQPYVQLTIDEFSIIADWYYFAVLSLAETKDFQSSTGYIAERLGITRLEADKAVKALLRLGLLVEKKGQLIATGKQFATTTDIANQYVRLNHMQGLDKAQEALYDVPVELREFSSMVLASSPEILPQVKTKLKKLRREIAALMESKSKTEVYRFSIQIFPISKKRSFQ